MKTIETNLHIFKNNRVQLTLPMVEELQPGLYHVVIVIDEQPVREVVKSPKKSLHLNVFEWEGWKSDSTFRREDMYGDDGR